MSYTGLSTLNIAAGNEFNTAVTLAKIEINEMKNIQKVRALDAEANQKAQNAELNAGWEYAASTMHATEKDAQSQMISGISSLGSAAISGACASPFKFGIGSTSSKEELSNLDELDKGVKKAIESKTGNTNAENTSSVENPNGSDVKIDKITQLEKWKSGDFSNINKDNISEDLTNAKGEDLNVIKEQIKNRRNEINEKRYDRILQKKTTLSNAANSLSQAASGTAQGINDTAKAKAQNKAGEEQALQTILSSNAQTINSNMSINQEAANNFANDAMQCLSINSQAI